MSLGSLSIFQEYYSDQTFADRFVVEPANAVDVLIPVIHTNELWHANLLSFYREIPVNRLLVGDGGCIDNSLEIVRSFPRVEVFDHRSFTSLGYSIRKLIEAVETEWFVYLHSDVYLPPDWFAVMRSHQGNFDWFECRQHLTFLIEYPLRYTDIHRPYSGSQVGRKAAFTGVLPMIDDDFLYRNEDIIIADLVKRAGFRYGRAEDAFHYHQVVKKTGPWSREIKSVSLEMQLGREEEIRACMMQVKGIIKYMDPDPQLEYLTNGIKANVHRLNELNELKWDDFEHWVAQVNPKWLPYISDISQDQLTTQNGTRPFRLRLRNFLDATLRLITG